ncbi:glutathione S-transferase [Haliangium ochraceum]|uniref:Glutathione S-transferase domain protein n=1 Tax=Haliangium ochraceum (strain DSM 14365 / JCM 11303 / SMP-2) TaxID=502025 RepID=D0LY28_HALO1|nr:glutathione S-transferase [Haliangium ochraceum]ACY14383.1 Glutathione S-transferase domain protein [Haliangium ochraceum DSM 14365]
MKLYYSPTSPYVRKVLITAMELGLDERIEQLPTQVTPTSPSDALNRANPLGKVPALETDDGDTLYDSRVICEYLDSLHQGVKLLPDSGPTRWDALRQQALGDGILVAAVLVRYEILLRPEELRWSDWLDGQWGKIERGLDAFEAEADALAGTVTLGSITAACALGYIDLRYPERDWRKGRDKLRHWMDGFASRASYQATMPPG